MPDHFNEKAGENIRWLLQQSHAHLHVDLIDGFPGEGVDSSARGFDKLVALQPYEIQFSILQRLRGTPIIAFGRIFDPYPPYNILATKLVDSQTIQSLQRFSCCWDLVANSGRFAHTLSILLDELPFTNFIAFSDWLYGKTATTHRIALDRLAGLVWQWLRLQGMSEGEVNAMLSADYLGKPLKQGDLQQVVTTIKNEG